MRHQPRRRRREVPRRLPEGGHPELQPVPDHRPGRRRRVRQDGDRERPGENPNLKLGVCGEHGGDPKSVAFFQEVGLDYVSCSPFRVPGARLAAAQAVLGE
ncbi:MAG: hypothetical protein M3522_11115 [Actinomycetota bacterium]|nr:hypothetical protein [Actinomycetota bacterium]